MENFKKLQKSLNEEDWSGVGGNNWTAYLVYFKAGVYVLQIIDADDIQHGLLPEMYMYTNLKELASFLNKKVLDIQEDLLRKYGEDEGEDVKEFWQEVKEIIDSILEEE